MVNPSGQLARLVLDTSAWLTYFENESGADIVQNQLEQTFKQHSIIIVPRDVNNYTSNRWPS
jgi:hypothetical protein